MSIGKMTSLAAPDDDLCVGSGLFWEYGVSSLDELAPALDRRSQTLISHGVAREEWAELITRYNLKIDRIVPFGQALQFDHIWDGIDLLTEFSRLVSLTLPE